MPSSTFFVCILGGTCFLVCTSGFLLRPNIIAILADDMGWNDVSYHGSPQIPTPNIDALAASGVILKRHYAAPQCTPSRASFLTGKYTTNTGLQHSVIVAGQARGLPLNLTTMPQYLKNLGYATHMVGKWHLGAHKKEFTPTYRGFDSFFGYWNGEMDHYDYTLLTEEKMWGLDLHDGLEDARCFQGRYAAEVFTQKAEEIIKGHNKSQPLFLLVSQIVPHTGNSYQRLQAKPENVAKFRYINDLERRTYAGAVAALDESIGNIFKTLYFTDMLNNSIIIFLSDNGAEVAGQRGGQGSNWPLRGSKMRLWEGGVRVPALIWSPLLRLKQPRISNHLMHISDWMPTFYAAAGGDVKDLKNIDGINMWKNLVRDHSPLRTEILLNVDPYLGMASLIKNDYKLVNGTFPNYYDTGRDGWYGPSGRDFNITDMDEWVWRNGSVVKDVLEATGRWLIKKPNKWRKNVAVDCKSPPAGNGNCDPKISPCLFNITADPCEYHNLASQLPEVVQEMIHRIKVLNSTSLETADLTIYPMADPRCYGFSYVPWLDEEYKHVWKLCDATAPEELAKHLS